MMRLRLSIVQGESFDHSRQNAMLARIQIEPAAVRAAGWRVRMGRSLVRCFRREQNSSWTRRMQVLDRAIDGRAARCRVEQPPGSLT